MPGYLRGSWALLLHLPGLNTRCLDKLVSSGMFGDALFIDVNLIVLLLPGSCPSREIVELAWLILGMRFSMSCQPVAHSRISVSKGTVKGTQANRVA